MDYQLCGLSAAFHALLDRPELMGFNTHLISGLAAVAALPAFEVSREKRHGLLAAHVVISLIYQRLTAAVILPIYWLIFTATGSASRSAGPGVKINKAQAEAVLFSLIFGYLLPWVFSSFKSHLTRLTPWIGRQRC